jgi:hypothetical protein
MVYRVATLVLFVALIAVMIATRTWLVLAVTVGMAIALAALQTHDRRQAASLSGEDSAAGAEDSNES